MEWRDEGTVLSVRPHGETSAILDVFTPGHGRHAGVVRGGVSRRVAPMLQQGADLAVVWRARIEEQLGSFTCEPLRSRALLFEHRLTLAGVGAVTALLALSLPERDPHPGLHAATRLLLDLAPDPAHWALGYLHWELALLEEMGFGLDLSACAVTGAREGLVHVSPRSGRAVSRAGAGEWADRLLPLPPVMLGQGAVTGPGIAAALVTTGWFIEHRLLQAHGGRAPPAARGRLVDEIRRGL
ncbi:MAG: DNA repair protein RecO [Rubellimicrobium sp.]|nr:DNA repair protein RecO [Rubellimicrobium sp.]